MHEMSMVFLRPNLSIIRPPNNDPINRPNIIIVPKSRLLDSSVQTLKNKCRIVQNYAKLSRSVQGYAKVFRNSQNWGKVRRSA